MIRNEVGGQPRGAQRAAKTSSAAGRRAAGRRTCGRRNGRGQAHGRREEVGGSLKDPAEAYRGSRTAAGAESRAGYHSIRRRPGGRERAGKEMKWRLGVRGWRLVLDQMHLVMYICIARCWILHHEEAAVQIFLHMDRLSKKCCSNRRFT